jgi:drug/metabolite transporter (DMT)-like permease
MTENAIFFGCSRLVGNDGGDSMNIWNALFDALSIFWGMVVFAWKYGAPIALLIIGIQAHRKYSWSCLGSAEFWKIILLIAFLPAGIAYVAWLWIERRIERYDAKHDGRLRIEIRRSS